MNIRFPEKQIVKIIMEETISKFKQNNIYDNETREMMAVHIEKIGELKTYAGINSWLIQYRGLTLQEWVDSL